MSNQYMSIPIAILIFDNNGQIYYHAFSPKEYHYRPDGSSPDHSDGQISQFLAHIYNRISYNPQNTINNVSLFGKLKEIHTRHIYIPITERGNICYFSTYANQYTNYRPIHTISPIFFIDNQAKNYANQQPNLFHTSCQHEFL